MKTNATRRPFCRRDFLKQISLAGVGGLILPRRILARWPDALSRVVIVEHSSATNGNTINANYDTWSIGRMKPDLAPSAPSKSQKQDEMLTSSWIKNW